MRIHSLQLQNFHGFEALDLPLDPSLTLLIGENGAGKSAVLEGLAVALGGFFLEMHGATGRSIDKDDVRAVVSMSTRACSIASRSGRYVSRPEGRSRGRASNGRAVVAMVADIAWRCAVLNPHLGANATGQSEGVILIDEIDLHLHPRWQRRVVRDLRRVFPRLQLVATTHSPQVLSSVRREEVRVLQSNMLVDAHPYVEGRDSNGLLEDVLGVSERPDETQARIDELFRLLDDEEYEPAAAQLEGLEAQLGPDDPAVLRARWILDREAIPKDGG